MGASVNLYTIGLNEAESIALEALQDECNPNISFVLVPTSIEELLAQESWDHGLLIYSFATSDADTSALGKLDGISALQMKHGSFPWIGVSTPADNFATFLIHHTGAIGSWRHADGMGPLEALLATVEEAQLQDLGKPFPLLCLLQFACAFEERVIFRIRSSGGEIGFLQTSNGKLHYGKTMDGVLGDAAVLALLSWNNPGVDVMKPQIPLRENIKGPLDVSLMRIGVAWDTQQKSVDGPLLSLSAQQVHQLPSKSQRYMSDTPVPIGLGLLPLGPSSSQKLPVELGELCQVAVEGNPDVIACGVVDLVLGTLVGVHHKLPNVRASFEAAIQKMAMNSFFGDHLKDIERSLSSHENEAGSTLPEEIFLRASSSLCFMKRLPDQDIVVVLLTEQYMNQGLGWFQVKECCDNVGHLLATSGEVSHV